MSARWGPVRAYFGTTPLSLMIVAPERRTPAYLNKYVPEEIASWARIIKDSGVVPK